MQVKDRPVLGATFGICTLLAVGDLESARAQNLDNPRWPTHEWLTSTPEEQGMDSSTLAKLVTDGESQSFDSLLIVRHGRIVAEAYYAPYTADIPHQIHSSTKAIISTLIGMLRKDGVLDRLDRPVLDFFADRGVANVDDRKKAITVQNLLDMTSGFDWDQGIEDGKEQTLVDMTLSPNWTQFILDRPMAHAPGEVFNYTDANPHLAFAIITRLTGKLAEDYAREKLFSPLGITDWHWDRDPQGLTMGAWTLTMLPRDMAKIGYLYLRHGEWDGRQLLPSGWAEDGFFLRNSTVDSTEKPAHQRPGDEEFSAHQVPVPIVQVSIDNGCAKRGAYAQRCQGPSFRSANADQESRLQRHRDSGHRPGSGGEHRDFQHRQCCLAPAPAFSRSRSSGRLLGTDAQYE